MLRPRSEAGPESSEQIMAELRENTLSQLEELYPQFITILSNYNYEGVETITNFEQVII